MPDPAENLLKQARIAYQQGQKRKGDVLVQQVLDMDFNHRKAWELLRKQYGPKKKLSDFQKTFAGRYYPEKMHLLGKKQSKKDPQPAASSPKPSFLTRLKGLFSRPKKAPDEDRFSEGRLDALQTSPPAGPQVPPASISTSSLPPLPAAAPQAPAPARPSNGTNGNSRPSVKVIIVDDNAETRDNVARALRFQPEIEVCGSAWDGASGIRLAQEIQPDVVLMDVNMPDMDGITATTQVRRAVPAAQVIILTVQDDTDYMRKAMLAGARDFLTKPPVIEDLISAVLRAAEIAHLEKARVDPVLPSAAASTASIGRGKLISVYSPKGGSGCTVLAANLAATLHNEETPVVIVDGNLQYGDVCVLFNEQSKNSAADLTPRAKELDPEIVDEVLVPHSSGIKILAAPRPEQAEAVTGAQFADVLNYLTKLYSYVIVDTASHLSDVTLAALDASDLVVLVATQDIPGLGNVRKFLDLAPVIGLPHERILLVMNSFDKRLNISPERVGQTFRQEVAAVIPMEPGIVVPSINRGVPFMMQRELFSKPLGQAMLALAQAVRQRLSAAVEILAM